MNPVNLEISRFPTVGQGVLVPVAIIGDACVPGTPCWTVKRSTNCARSWLTMSSKEEPDGSWIPTAATIDRIEMNAQKRASNMPAEVGRNDNNLVQR